MGDAGSPWHDWLGIWAVVPTGRSLSGAGSGYSRMLRPPVGLVTRPRSRSGGPGLARGYPSCPELASHLPGRVWMAAMPCSFAQARISPLRHLDQPLTVDALAARASMSPRTFARRFRQRTGATPASWVNRQRVLFAARLLECGNDTITSVSTRSGFGSPDTLRRHFIHARRVTPSQYRRAFRLTEPGTSTPGPAGPQGGHDGRTGASPTPGPRT
jgi:AraC-like DNA-binding protein